MYEIKQNFQSTSKPRDEVTMHCFILILVCSFVVISHQYVIYPTKSTISKRDIDVTATARIDIEDDEERRFLKKFQHYKPTPPTSVHRRRKIKKKRKGRKKKIKINKNHLKRSNIIERVRSISSIKRSLPLDNPHPKEAVLGVDNVVPPSSEEQINSFIGDFNNDLTGKSEVEPSIDQSSAQLSSTNQSKSEDNSTLSQSKSEDNSTSQSIGETKELESDENDGEELDDLKPTDSTDDDEVPPTEVTDGDDDLDADASGIDSDDLKFNADSAADNDADLDSDEEDDDDDTEESFPTEDPSSTEKKNFINSNVTLTDPVKVNNTDNSTVENVANGDIKTNAIEEKKDNSSTEINNNPNSETKENGNNETKENDNTEIIENGNTEIIDNGNTQTKNITDDQPKNGENVKITVESSAPIVSQQTDEDQKKDKKNETPQEKHPAEIEKIETVQSDNVNLTTGSDAERDFAKLQKLEQDINKIAGDLQSKRNDILKRISAKKKHEADIYISWW